MHTAIVFVIFHLVYMVLPAACFLAPVYLFCREGVEIAEIITIHFSFGYFPKWDASKTAAVILPLLWFATFDGSSRKLGKPWPTLARWKGWSLLFSWFPITIEKPSRIQLDGSKIYVFAVHPHGALAFNRAAFGFDIDNLWRAAFPGVDFRVLTATAAFYVPVIRELWLWTYCVDARVLPRRASERGERHDQENSSQVQGDGARESASRKERPRVPGRRAGADSDEARQARALSEEAERLCEDSYGDGR